MLMRRKLVVFRVDVSRYVIEQRSEASISARAEASGATSRKSRTTRLKDTASTATSFIVEVQSSEK